MAAFSSHNFITPVKSPADASGAKIRRRRRIEAKLTEAQEEYFADLLGAGRPFYLAVLRDCIAANRPGTITATRVALLAAKQRGAKTRAKRDAIAQTFADAPFVSFDEVRDTFSLGDFHVTIFSPEWAKKRAAIRNAQKRTWWLCSEVKRNAYLFKKPTLVISGTYEDLDVTRNVQPHLLDRSGASPPLNIPHGDGRCASTAGSEGTPPLTLVLGLAGPSQGAQSRTPLLPSTLSPLPDVRGGPIGPARTLEPLQAMRSEPDTMPRTFFDPRMDHYAHRS